MYVISKCCQSPFKGTAVSIQETTQQWGGQVNKETLALLHHLISLCDSTGKELAGAQPSAEQHETLTPNYYSDNTVLYVSFMPL